MPSARPPSRIVRPRLAWHLAAVGLVVGAAPGQNWPQFRGEQASGVSEGKPTPVDWSIESGRNVRWKTAIPGLGHSSPVAWGERIYLTTAVRDADAEAPLKVGLYGDIEPVSDEGPHRWQVLCVERGSGAIVWTQTACQGVPKIKRHPKSTHANSTPATDGRHVVAFFGSEGLFCYDADGKLLWKLDLGLLDSGYYVVPGAQWAFGSSPVIFDEMVIVQCDVQGESFLAAYHLRDGRELWRTRRAEVPTWSTPTVHRVGDRTLVLVNGYRHIGGYDARTGAEVWRLTGGGDIPVPTPVVAHDLVFITNAHGPMHPVYAVRLTATGDVTPASEQDPGPAVAWWRRTRGNYMQTPLVYGDLLYCCRDDGILSVFQARSGESIYRKRLGSGGSGFTASPVAADGKVYFTSEEGEVFVVKAGATFELLATNPLGEVCMATPAISDGTLYFRTRGHLIAIGGG